MTGATHKSHANPAATRSSAGSPGDATGPCQGFNSRYILHVDADAFFASVEQTLQPELRGKAVIVGGGDRGVVSAASYEARAFGVRSAMPMVQARRLCPHAIFLEPNFHAYKDYSRKMFAIMELYSPLVEVTSVDEGYVDLTGTLKLHNAPPWEIAHRMLDRIRSSLDINVSGALAGSKTAAKMATRLAKPNGFLYLEPHLAWVILGSLPVHAIPGVGKHARQVLERRGIMTVAELGHAPRYLLRSLFGVWGEKLLQIAIGNDFRPVRSEPHGVQKSYSKERTLAQDTVDYEFVRNMARKLAEKLAAKVREDGQGATTVTFKVRYADFVDCSRSMSLPEPTNVNADILACIDRLFWKTIQPRRPIRQIGVKLSGIYPPGLQLHLFASGHDTKEHRDSAVDAIRQKYGFESIGTSGAGNVPSRV
ncbi:MAG: DNA polymerase IV [Thermodesulfobacteriota bacterium]